MHENEHKVDRTGWAPGPWDNESEDKINWVFEGFDCMMVRHSLGHWCGYVGVPKTHLYFEKDYDDCNVSVHGGLTYADHCTGHICHEPEPGRPDNVWWLGFDCAHLGDLSPVLSSLSGTYRAKEYVKNEVEDLAKQLKGFN